MGLTLHPDPSGDDWAQITAALTTLRAAGRGWLELEQITNQPFNIKKAVNGTALHNVDIRVQPGLFIRCDGFTGDGTGRPAPMFDFSNSYRFSVTGQGGVVSGFFNGLDAQSPTGTVEPLCAVLFANGDTKTLKDMGSTGSFKSCALGIISCSDIDIEGGGYGNDDSNAPVVVMSSIPDWGLWSPYSTFGGMPIVADVYLRTRIHSPAMWGTYLRNGQNIHFDHVLSDNRVRAHYLVQGTGNNNIVFTSGKCYAETQPSTCTAVLECSPGQQCSNLKMVGIYADGLTLNTGGGTFPGLQIV